MAGSTVNLAWTVVSSDTLAAVGEERSAAGQAELLATALGVEGMGADGAAGERAAILSDMYANAYRFALEQRFTGEKISALLAIIHRVHSSAVGECLTMPRAFALFKELALQHSVQRPPYSVGVFSLADMKAVVNFGLLGYFKHYKLYMYAFTKKRLTNLSERGDLCEAPPALPPLGGAMTQEEWLELKEKERLEEEERKRAEEEAAAAKREEEIKAKIQEEYETALGDDVAAQVQAVFDRQLPEMEATLKAKYESETAALAERLAALEAGGA